jgi:hypothetical protein
MAAHHDIVAALREAKSIACLAYWDGTEDVRQDEYTDTIERVARDLEENYYKYDVPVVFGNREYPYYYIESGGNAINAAI